MKKLLFIIIVFFAINTFAQVDCRPYVPLDKGTKWELTNYNDKGKELGKISSELLDKVESGNTVTFKIRSVSTDAKGKTTFSNEYEAYCKNGKFEFNMAFKMDGSTMQAYQDMDMKVDASDLEIPSMDEKPGTTLPDGTLTVSIGNILNMSVNIVDRKIEAKETITTPAGSFDCLVLTQTVNTKMLVKIEASSKEWYAEGVGMVRSETYNKKGKLSGYSELTKLEK